MPNTTPISGLHHITAISGPPQPNVDFYVGTLKQRLIKQTVNFDAPDVWHLYYGSADAAPGSILTFFPFIGARRGHAGPGMASAFGYGIAADEVAGLAERLNLQPSERFGAQVLRIPDPDGLSVEMIAQPAAGGYVAGAADGPVDRFKDRSRDVPSGGFHSVTLWLRDFEPTARLLVDGFGYAAGRSERGRGGERLRLELPGAGPGRVIDLWRSDIQERSIPGAGTIHHIAFRARDNAHQDALRERLLGLGMNVTPRIDRQYFNAIYFREPGGVLFEVATDPPGFAIDEAPDALGTALKLPPQYEPRRAQIAAALPPFKVPS